MKTCFLCHVNCNLINFFYPIRILEQNFIFELVICQSCLKKEDFDEAKLLWLWIKKKLNKTQKLDEITLLQIFEQNGEIQEEVKLWRHPISYYYHD